jgi:hypothetical protein
MSAEKSGDAGTERHEHPFLAEVWPGRRLSALVVMFILLFGRPH